MKLAVCPQLLYDRSLEEGLAAIAALGLAGLELPVDARSPWVDLEHLLAGGAAELKRSLARHGLALTAISNHQEGQILLGPHHSDTDAIHAGTAAEKRAYARRRLLLSARLASELEVGLVVGFVGCEDYTRSFPWPDPEGWEKMIPEFQSQVGSLLDEFDRLGVSFAQEPHPKQFVFDVETALESVQHLGAHRRWGFNLDPANLLLAGIDPVVFAHELKERVLHVHAKDGERVAHNAARSGFMARGRWDRLDRGFRFRVPGWGDVPWKRLVTELILVGYDGWLTIENEDPVFEPLDGLQKAIAELAPLLPRGRRREGRWW